VAAKAPRRFPLSDENLYFLKSGIADRIQAFLLRAVLARLGRNVYFVQVGANDGKTHDPLSYIVRNEGWRGIMFEPVPVFFERLMQNYRGVEGLTFMSKACGDKPGRVPFYQVKNVDVLPHDFMRGLSSFDRGLVARHFQTPELWDRFVEQVDVEVVTLNRAVAEIGVERVDLLQIDAEGSDLQVLAGFELERFRPSLVMLETMHIPPAQQQQLWARMAGLGYERAIGALDSFFIPRDFLSSPELDLLGQFRFPVLAVL